MQEKLTTILNHFGFENKLDKLKEETNELLEAIQEDDRQHTLEEMADVLIVIQQIAIYYGFTEEALGEMYENKINRTIKRIETGFYEKRSRSDEKGS
jgi:NTP pyrophosphatase (non-canonical NTP hydrolase)